MTTGQMSQLWSSRYPDNGHKYVKNLLNNFDSRITLGFLSTYTKSEKMLIERYIEKTLCYVSDRSICVQ